MKIVITHNGDNLDNRNVRLKYEADIFIEICGDICYVFKNVNHNMSGEPPPEFPLDELPQYIRQEKIIYECQPKPNERRTYRMSDLQSPFRIGENNG